MSNLPHHCTNFLLALMTAVALLAGCGRQPQAQPTLTELFTLTELDLNGDGRTDESLRAFSLENQSGVKSGMLKIEFSTPDNQADGSTFVETIHFPDGYPVAAAVKNNILSVTIARANGSRDRVRYKIDHSSVYSLSDTPDSDTRDQK